jgi:hypothetical protein
MCGAYCSMQNPALRDFVACINADFVSIGHPELCRLDTNPRNQSELNHPFCPHNVVSVCEQRAHPLGQSPQTILIPSRVSLLSSSSLFPADSHMQ